MKRIKIDKSKNHSPLYPQAEAQGVYGAGKSDQKKLSGPSARFAIEKHLHNGGSISIPNLEIELIGRTVKPSLERCAVCGKEPDDCGWFEDCAPYPSDYDSAIVVICGNCFAEHIDPLLKYVSQHEQPKDYDGPVEMIEDLPDD